MLNPTHQRTHHTRRLLPWACALALLAACASPLPATTWTQRLSTLPPHDLLLLGEQHDVDEHQALERATVAHLAAQGRLAALVLEMAERGTSTAGLPRDASEAQAQAALRWNQAGWPWERYGPAVMAAVRAGVPVLGGNLPRTEMGAAMRDASLDQRLPPAGLQAQQVQIREGHCGLLPEAQVPGMVRIQVARDQAMARTLAEATAGGRQVLLLAGGQHVRRDRGVPAHLPPALAARTQAVLMVAGGDSARAEGVDLAWPTPAVPPKDHCAGLRERFRPGS
jgi:uncharacterized iron-regulated protein